MPKKGLTLRLAGFISLFILSHFSHHLLTALVVPMLPFIRDSFSLSYAAAGLVASAFNFANGLGQLPAGWLADKFGPRTLMTVGLAGVALAGALVGISSSIFLLVLFLVLMGFAGGGYHPSAPPIIVGAVGSANRGRALGFHVIGGSLSHFISPVIGTSLAMIWGWRGAFLGTSVPVFAFGVFFFLFLGKIGVGGRVKSIASAGVRGASSELPDAPSTVHLHMQKSSTESRRKNLRLTAFLLLTGSATAFGQACITFVPLIMIDFFSIGEQGAALTLALVYSAGFWAAPISGYLSDKVGRIPILIAMAGLLIPVIGLVTFLPYGPFTYIIMLGFGISLFTRMPVSEAFIFENTSEERRSTILGIYYAIGMSGGALLTPLIGMGVDRLGFSHAFGLTAGVYGIVVLVLVSILGITREKKAELPA